MAGIGQKRLSAVGFFAGLGGGQRFRRQFQNFLSALAGLGEGDAVDRGGRPVHQPAIRRDALVAL